MKNTMRLSKFNFLPFWIVPFFLVLSCNKSANKNEFSAYFGGEIVNPIENFVLLLKDNKVVDTIFLSKNNTFFKKFDSLTPGMYTFKHEPEYQYIYFEKNDSINVYLDAKNFDESVFFSGKGSEKNNFLIEMYLRNEKDLNAMFEVFDYNFKRFTETIDQTNQENITFYTKEKNRVAWGNAFDVYANALFQFPYYTKKEIYPVIHEIRTGFDVVDSLPKDYYDFRSEIDYGNQKLTDFSPFSMYLNHMLNNVASIKYHNHYSEFDLSLKTNINKLVVADSLIENEKVKNIVLNNIAFQYLLEDQNMVNNKEFLDTYHRLSTDKSKRNEIIELGSAIQNLVPGKQLPIVNFYDKEGRPVTSEELVTKKTVFFFWSEKLNSHFILSHKKVLEFQKEFPDYNFVAVNLDGNQTLFKQTLAKYKLHNIKEVSCKNFEDLKLKWAITKVHRTIIVDENGKITNGFTNIFDSKFTENLK
jgi:hypothetical protein